MQKIQDLMKKYKHVLTKLEPGDNLPNIDGYYLSTNDLLELFREKFPVGKGRIVPEVTFTANEVVAKYDIYGDDVLLGTGIKVITLDGNPDERNAQIAQAQNNAKWQALCDAGFGTDFICEARRQQNLKKIQEIEAMAEEKKAKKAALAKENEDLAMSAEQTFDALIKLNAVNKVIGASESVPSEEVPEEKPKKKAASKKTAKTSKKSTKKTPEASEASFDPFAAEGIKAPSDDGGTNEEVPVEDAEVAETPEATEAPETEVSVETEAEKPEPSPAPEEEADTVDNGTGAEYVISEGDFANNRYASKYAGKKLSDVSKAELKAVLSFGDKAITPAFAEVIEEYLKG